MYKLTSDQNRTLKWKKPVCKIPSKAKFAGWDTMEEIRAKNKATV